MPGRISPACVRPPSCIATRLTASRCYNARSAKLHGRAHSRVAPNVREPRTGAIVVP